MLNRFSGEQLADKTNAIAGSIIGRLHEVASTDKSVHVHRLQSQMAGRDIRETEPPYLCRTKILQTFGN